MKKIEQLVIPYIVWAVLMIVLPMVLILFYAITDSGNGIISFKLTLEHFAKFFTDKDFLLILWRSLKIAIKTTIICLIIGSLLWKKANHIDPASEKNKVKFFLWNNMGLIVAVFAFVPVLCRHLRPGTHRRLFASVFHADTES